jgi:Alpha-L-fucosidase./F5/8 type C domain.
MYNHHWYKSARMGLFIHWGFNTGNPGFSEGVPLYKSIQEFEQAVNHHNWTAKKWVDAARKLRASYITLATFHSVLGYIRSWKSDIPGTPVMERDVLSELIEEGKKQGLKILVYITGDPANHNWFKEFPWINSEEYARFKGDNRLDIKDSEIWQRVYCKDVIEELLEKYPAVGGFWFDGWNSSCICKELFGFIHGKDPQKLIIRNNFGEAPIDEEDVMGLECFGKVYEPDFDLASGAWVDPVGKEFTYVMPELSDWFHYYPPKDYDKAVLIKKMVTIAANGWVAKMGLGPDIGGSFPGTMANFIEDVNCFYNWAEESIFGTQPGGLPQCRLNDGAYAVTTHRPEEGIYYIHVLTPPKSNLLIIPDGGIDFISAKELRGGNILEFDQKEGQIRIKADFNHICSEEGDMIVRLEGNGTRCSYSYTIKDYMTELPICTEIDLSDKKMITGLILEEDDTSAVSKGGWAAPDNNRMKEYEVSASIDGVCFKKVQKGVLGGARGVKQLNFDGVEARYIRLCALSSQDTRGGFVKKFTPPYWQSLDYEGIQSYAADSCGIEYLVTEENDLFVVNGSNRYVKAEKVKRVFTGRDGRLYYITLEGELASEGIKLGIQADRAAVANNGEIWHVKGDSLFDGTGKRISKDVKDVAIDMKDCLWYCGNGYICRRCDGIEERWNIEYNASTIAASVDEIYILDESQRVFGVSAKGLNTYIICKNTYDIATDSYGVLHAVQSPQKGRLRIRNIRALIEGSSI